MRTNVAQSSIDAYYGEILPDEKNYTKQIEDFICRHQQGTTRREIATRLNLDTATVSGIVKPLLQSGRIVVVDRKACPITGRSVDWLQHKSNLVGTTGRLFA